MIWQERNAKIIFFGTSEFAVPILEKLTASQWRPDLVVSTPATPAGRGLEPKSPPVKTAAERFGIPVIQLADLKIENCLPAEASAQAGKLKIPVADLFIVAAYGKILPKELLEIPKHGSLNIHPSLLPRWRGASPIQYTILHGDEETGVTIILMDEKVDHGPIIRNSKSEIRNPKLTAPELSERLAAAGAELLLETIPDWLAGKIEPQPQDESGATYAPRLKKEDGHIDWTKPAEELERQIRAFQPWPGVYTFWPRGDKKLRLSIEGARCEEKGAGERNILPGTVGVFDDQLTVMTGQGFLVIERLKPEGSNSMSGQEFLRGHADIISAVLK